LVKDIGDIHEIEITAQRDLVKWDIKNIDKFNVYQYWLSSQNLEL
jgi:hypothetical protein